MNLKRTRSCDGCTACCDGRLSTNVFGRKTVGQPCHYLGENKCSIYKHRPKDPCKIFECSWLKDKHFKYPEWLKPDKSGLLLMDWKKTKSGIPYIIAIANKDLGYSNDAVFWLINYCNNNNLNIEFILQGVKHYIGSKEFKKYFKR